MLLLRHLEFRRPEKTQLSRLRNAFSCDPTLRPVGANQYLAQSSDHRVAVADQAFVVVVISETPARP